MRRQADSRLLRHRPATLDERLAAARDLVEQGRLADLPLEHEETGQRRRYLQRDGVQHRTDGIVDAHLDAAGHGEIEHRHAGPYARDAQVGQDDIGAAARQQIPHARQRRDLLAAGDARPDGVGGGTESLQVGIEEAALVERILQPEEVSRGGGAQHLARHQRRQAPMAIHHQQRPAADRVARREDALDAGLEEPPALPRIGPPPVEPVEGRDLDGAIAVVGDDRPGASREAGGLLSSVPRLMLA